MSATIKKKYAEIENISILGVTAKMAPLGLIIYAENYLKAAESLPMSESRFDPVCLYLACHSIELSLKSYLSLQGSTMLELKKLNIGHNLTKLINQCLEEKIGNLILLSEEHVSEIKNADVYYSGKVFEYPAIGDALEGYPQTPSLQHLISIAKNLVSVLKEQCLNA